MLEIASPPLIWRRQQIKEGIQQKIKEYTRKNESFFFWDIGSGAGFDSIEIERLIRRINVLTDNSLISLIKVQMLILILIGCKIIKS